jgi:hypothetical protein
VLQPLPLLLLRHPSLLLGQFARRLGFEPLNLGGRFQNNVADPLKKNTRRVNGCSARR